MLSNVIARLPSRLAASPQHQAPQTSGLREPSSLVGSRYTLRDDHPRREKRPHGPVGAGENTEPCGSSHYTHGLEDRCVGDQAALVMKISVRFNMLRKVHSWDTARRCTICDSVTARSARRRTAKTCRFNYAELRDLRRALYSRQTHGDFGINHGSATRFMLLHQFRAKTRNQLQC